MGDKKPLSLNFSNKKLQKVTKTTQQLMFKGLGRIRPRIIKQLTLNGEAIVNNQEFVTVLSNIYGIKPDSLLISCYEIFKKLHGDRYRLSFKSLVRTNYNCTKYLNNMVTFNDNYIFVYNRLGRDDE